MNGPVRLFSRLVLCLGKLLILRGFLGAVGLVSMVPGDWNFTTCHIMPSCQMQEHKERKLTKFMLQIVISIGNLELCVSSICFDRPESYIGLRVYTALSVVCVWRAYGISPPLCESRVSEPVVFGG